jgi:hypothetical protein
MNCMPFVNDLVDKAKKYNIATGIIIFDLIAMLSLIIPFYLFYFGDIEITIGVIIGMIFTFRTLKPGQGILKMLSYFIFLGTFLVSLTLSMILFVILIPYYGIDPIIFLSLFVTFLIMIFIIVLIIGIIAGYYYSNKIKSAKNKKEDEFEDFFGGMTEI